MACLGCVGVAFSGTTRKADPLVCKVGRLSIDTLCLTYQPCILSAKFLKFNSHYLVYLQAVKVIRQTEAIATTTLEAAQITQVNATQLWNPYEVLDIYPARGDFSCIGRRDGGLRAVGDITGNAGNADKTVPLRGKSSKATPGKGQRLARQGYEVPRSALRDGNAENELDDCKRRIEELEGRLEERDASVERGKHAAEKIDGLDTQLEASKKHFDNAKIEASSQIDELEKQLKDSDRRLEEQEKTKLP
ncbi:hypothetical protein ABVK25_001232 [Lepraria finkii]|uniref:Uncharacterized protein n=1 Tax=Lepraria finkii TaxID=1340010 RepID=A0ABR4BP20_9LECA